jgi:hypothetical protein
MPDGNLTIYGTMTYVSRAIETIDEAPVPLAAPTWALLNLLFAAAAVVASAILLGGLLKKNESLSEPRRKKRAAIRLSTLLPAIGAVVAFLLTQNLANTMVLTDRWTLLMGAILAVQAVLTVFGLRTSKE